MERGLILLTIAAYGLAVYLWWSAHTPNYLIGLLAGQLGSLLSPLWQRLYRFAYDESFVALYTLFDRPLPRPIFLGAWLTVFPALAIFYLYRHHWWFSSYLTGMFTFVLFVLYHLLIDALGMRAGWWRYEDLSGLPFGLPAPMLSAIMSGLVSLGVLSALLLTRRYSWTSLLLFLLPVPLGLNLFIYGLLGAPLYTVLLLRAQSWAGVIGMVGTLGLLGWAAHIIALALEQRHDWRRWSGGTL